MGHTPANLLFLGCLLLGTPAYGESGPAGLWAEQEGMIVFEAENGSGTWTVVQDPAVSGGAYVNDPGSGEMHFQLAIKSPGKWQIHMLAMRGMDTPASDDENDCCIFINKERIYGSDDETRPEGMRINGTGWGWTTRPKGPGGHTPDVIKNGDVHLRVAEPGIYTFTLAHRSVNFNIDKIVLKHESRSDASTKPDGHGPGVTRVSANGVSYLSVPEMAIELASSWPGEVPPALTTLCELVDSPLRADPRAMEHYLTELCEQLEASEDEGIVEPLVKLLGGELIARFERSRSGNRVKITCEFQPVRCDRILKAELTPASDPDSNDKLPSKRVTLSTKPKATSLSLRFSGDHTIPGEIPLIVTWQFGDLSWNQTVLATEQTEQ